MIAAVVVTFSATPDALDRCVRALCAESVLDRIVVVDTGGAAEIADDLAETVRLVRTDNRGYGAAGNLGFAEASGATAVLLLNDDAVVQPGSVEPLVAALDDPAVGAAQPVLVGRDHAVATSVGVRLDRFGAGIDVGEGEPAAAIAAGDLEIFTGGAVMFSDRFLTDTGGFDESYFLYYEDVDLALRGVALGWRYRLVPTSLVEHVRGMSTGPLAELTRFHQERNRLWAAFRFARPMTMARAVELSIRRLRHEPRGVHARALLAGLAGAPRRFADRARRRCCLNP